MTSSSIVVFALVPAVGCGQILNDGKDHSHSDHSAPVRQLIVDRCLSAVTSTPNPSEIIRWK